MYKSIFLEEGSPDTEPQLPCGTIVNGKGFGSWRYKYITCFNGKALEVNPENKSAAENPEKQIRILKLKKENIVFRTQNLLALKCVRHRQVTI